MDKAITDMINTECAIFDTFPVPENIDLGGYTLGDCVKIELARFMTYLAIADGMISQDESDAIGEMMEKLTGDKAMTPELVAQLAKVQNSYSAEFDSTAPSTLVIAVQADNTFIENGLSEAAVLSMTILQVYKYVGQYFINMDGKATQGELLNYSTYMQMLEEYRNEHFRGADEDDDGNEDEEEYGDDEIEDDLIVNDDEIENMEDISTASPVKKGVKAPRKG